MARLKDVIDEAVARGYQLPRVDMVRGVEQRVLQWLTDEVREYPEGCVSGKNEFLEQCGAPTIHTTLLYQVRLRVDAVDEQPDTEGLRDILNDASGGEWVCTEVQLHGEVNG